MQLGYTLGVALLGWAFVDLPAAQAGDLEPGKRHLEVASADGAHSLQLSGRLLYDVGGIDSDVRSLQGDTQHVDSLRLALGGTVARHIDYAVEVDVANAIRADDPQVELKDAWVAYTGFKSWILRLGQAKESFSLEEETSSSSITFMERALPNVFAPGYHAGAAVIYQGPRWQATLGYYDRSTGPGSDDLGWGYSGRVSAAPIYDETGLLHLGASMAFRDPADNSVRFRSHPESGLTSEYLVNTGNIGHVSDYAAYGVEAAWVHGPWSVQAEYMVNRVNRYGGRADAEFQGGYVYASWFLTGESRAYSPKRGVFTRVKANGHHGALELALRRSMLDLNDAGEEGGVERNWTLGLNWYFSENARLMANAIWVDSSRHGVDDNPRLLQARLQFEF